MSSSKSVQEERQWKKTVISMKRDIEGYLQLQGSREECAMDLLQALYSEDLSDAIKVMVLGALQELSTSILTENTSIEQAIGTLIGYFQEVTINNGSTFLRSQILVSMTTILLIGDQLREQPSLFIDVTNLLFDIISKVNQGVDRTMRETACQCLEEMDVAYPGVMMNKLDHFYAMSQLERTHVRQSYVSLLNSALKNAISLKCQQAALTKDEISDLLMRRKEPLKPLMLPDMIPEELFRMQPDIFGSESHLPEHVEKSELQGAVMKSLDNLSVMSEADTVKAIRDLSCICSTCGSSMEIFQDMPRNLTSSLSLPLFHIQLYLLKKYFPESSAVPIQSLIRHVTHPSLGLGHHLFCMQFCMDNSIQISLEDEDMYAFKPTIFDSLDETVTKLQFAISLQMEGITTSHLLSYLEPLMISVRNGALGKSAVACFRGLFTIYLNDPSEATCKALSDFIVEEAVSQHPHFADHALNFISCISDELPKSDFSSQLLQSLTNFISQLSPEKCLENIEYFLKVFNAAAMERTIQLKPVTKYLQDLFNTTSVLEDKDWLLGNQMIQICHNIMLHPSLPSLFTSVGEILFALMTCHADTNIRDVARFYYSMLIYLSEEKIKAILTSLEASSNGQSLTNLVTGTNTFPLAAPVVHLQQPVLQLKRLRRSHNCKSLISSVDTRSVDEYVKTISANTELPKILLDFEICKDVVEPELQISKLYAIVLSVKSPAFYEDVEDIHIPYFSLDSEGDSSDEGCTVSLSIVPKEPNPASLQTSVVFTSTDNNTYACKLEPVVLEFEDFFLPLPLPSDERLGLFNQLWSHIDGECQRGDTLCIQSVTTLPLTSSSLQPVLEGRLSEYIIADRATEADAGGCFNIGILLPPRWHLLIKMKTTDITIATTISTDNWKVLPLVSYYLRSLIEEDMVG